MELKTFIKQSLLDIAGAIKEANEDNTTNMIINPTEVSGGRGQIVKTREGKYVDLQHIKFDVAVTVGNTIAGEAGAGINVASLKIGGSGQVTDEQETVSHIQFEVPVALPSEER